jgi:hypothetical protein
MRNKQRGKNMVTNVRIVDQNAGTDGAYVDRCVAQFQNSHSQVSVLCQDSYSLTTSSTGGSGVFGASQIRLCDEFASLGAQFETYRIRAVRFDVYDQSPNVQVSAWFSTFHDSYFTAAQPIFTLSNIIDGPDSAQVPPGTGKLSLYWRATGTSENEFQSTLQAGTSVPALDFGGLRYQYSSSTPTAITKYTIIFKAIVDFRGRL